MWAPPWIARRHCPKCRDGWVGRTPCPLLLLEQAGVVPATPFFQGARWGSKKNTPEHRENLRASALARWARERAKRTA